MTTKELIESFPNIDASVFTKGRDKISSGNVSIHIDTISGGAVIYTLKSYVEPIALKYIGYKYIHYLVLESGVFSKTTSRHSRILIDAITTERIVNNVITFTYKPITLNDTRQFVSMSRDIAKAASVDYGVTGGLRYA